MAILGRTEFNFILLATLVAGTLDILSAFAFSSIKNVGPSTVLQSVAAGPFGDGMFQQGAGGAVLGLVIHFAIMTVMVSAYALVAPRLPDITARPLVAGTVFGLILYGVMYWIVLPARWPQIHPRTEAWDVANALFSHIVCVGIPVALLWCRQDTRDHHRASD